MSDDVETKPGVATPEPEIQKRKRRSRPELKQHLLDQVKRMEEKDRERRKATVQGAVEACKTIAGYNSQSKAATWANQAAALLTQCLNEV